MIKLNDVEETPSRRCLSFLTVVPILLGAVFGFTATIGAAEPSGWKGIVSRNGEVMGQSGDVEIHVLELANRDDRASVSTVATTDDDGSFSFRVRSPRRPFVFLAVGPGFVDVRGPYGSADQVPTRLIFRGERVGNYRAALLDSSGVPVAAKISLRSVGGLLLPHAVRQHVTAQSSDSDGLFSLPFLEGAGATVEVHRQNQPNWILHAAPQSGELRLPGAEACSGAVVDRLREPIAHASIELKGFASGGSWHAVGNSREDGTYRLQVSGLAQERETGSARSVLVIRKEGYAPLQAGPSLEKICGGVFELEAASRIEVRVDGSEGIPDRSANVLLRLSSLKRYDRVQETSSGRAVFGELASGTYTLELFSRSGGSRRVGPMELDAGEAVVLDVQGTGRASAAGTVVDSDGSPVVQARVRVMGGQALPVEAEADWLPTGWTDKLGRFNFDDLLADGKIKVEVFKEGYGWFLGELDSSLSAPTIVLEREPGAVFGRVRSARHEDRHVVALINMDSTERVRYTNVDNGLYRFDGLPADNYEVRLVSLTGDRKTVSVARRPVRAHLGTPDVGGWVTGRLSIGDRPIPNAVIHIVPTAKNTRYTKTNMSPTTDREGVFRAWLATPGQYMANIDYSGLRLGSPLMTVKHLNHGGGLPRDPQLSEPISISLADTRIRGVVLDEDTGQPVPNAYFGLLMDLPKGSPVPRRAIQISGQTDENGEFEAAGLDPGVYKCSISAPGYLEPLDLPTVVVEERGVVQVKAFLKKGQTLRGDR